MIINLLNKKVEQIDSKWSSTKLKYKAQKIKIQPGINRRVLIIEDENSYGLWKFSKVNSLMKPREERACSYAWEAQSYYFHVVYFLNYLVEKGYNPETDLSIIPFEVAQQFYTLYCTEEDRYGERRSNYELIYMRSDLTQFLCKLQNVFPKSELSKIVLKECKKASNKRDTFVYALSMQTNRDFPEEPVNRECPDFFVREVLKYARIYDLEVWICVVFIYYVGLRPGSVLNLRHVNSIYGGNVECVMEATNDGAKLIQLKIHLKKEAFEKPLRSDNANMPGIKKPGVYEVDTEFMNIVFDNYIEYMLLTRDREREPFGPLIVNKRKKDGKYNMAYTAKNFNKGFKKIVNKYVIPALKKHGGEEEEYALGLENTKWGPHMFREGFTGRYVEENRGHWARLMYLRGDKNPETAIRYLLQDKVFPKITKAVSSDIADRMMEMNKDDIPELPYRL